MPAGPVLHGWATGPAGRTGQPRRAPLPAGAVHSRAGRAQETPQGKGGRGHRNQTGNIFIFDTS